MKRSADPTLETKIAEEVEIALDRRIVKWEVVANRFRLVLEEDPPSPWKEIYEEIKKESEDRRAAAEAVKRKEKFDYEQSHEWRNEYSDSHAMMLRIEDRHLSEWKEERKRKKKSKK